MCSSWNTQTKIQVLVLVQYLGEGWLLGLREASMIHTHKWRCRQIRGSFLFLFQPPSRGSGHNLRFPHSGFERSQRGNNQPLEDSLGQDLSITYSFSSGFSNFGIHQKHPGLLFMKCDWETNISITWELNRNGESQTLPQIYSIWNRGWGPTTCFNDTSRWLLHWQVSECLRMFTKNTGSWTPFTEILDQSDNHSASDCSTLMGMPSWSYL